MNTGGGGPDCDGSCIDASCTAADECATGECGLWWVHGSQDETVFGLRCRTEDDECRAGTADPCGCTRESTCEEL